MSRESSPEEGEILEDGELEVEEEAPAAGQVSLAKSIARLV